VYAKQRGSVAAPTAGLHFTPAVLDACRARGADIARLTLHVGLGTFQPLHAAGTSEVKLHAEWFSIAEGEAVRMREARRRIAVGTTSVRAIETAMRRGGLKAMTGETDLFIQPGFVFQATNAMLTNFHLPQSSLLILVCAFGGRELILDAYRHAVASGYRFYSYGDCMLIC
jgi:S-adenosylmethionine:tRNA ribosyltransferase-isomerase